MRTEQATNPHAEWVKWLRSRVGQTVTHRESVDMHLSFGGTKSTASGALTHYFSNNPDDLSRISRGLYHVNKVSILRDNVVTSEIQRAVCQECWLQIPIGRSECETC